MARAEPHCAVGESVEKPQLYHDNNVGGSVNLLAAMAAHGTRQIVFSSSATVYGDPQRLPLTEATENAFGTPFVCDFALVQSHHGRPTMGTFGPEGL